MKNKMSIKKSIAIFAPCMTALIAVMIALIIVAGIFSDTISLWLYGRAQNTDAKTLSAGTALCEDIVEEGIVLLKNEEDENGKPALPLSKEEIAKVNVFGWAAYDWMTMAYGSGYSNTKLEKMKLFPALKAAGIQYNETLFKMYKDFYSADTSVYSAHDEEYRGGVAFDKIEKNFILREPDGAHYTAAILEEAHNFSDVALVVIGRTGGESNDLRLYQEKQKQTNRSDSTINDNNRTYLELSTEEEQMIEAATTACSKVIVVLNTANVMETGFIDGEKIDAALHVGVTGLTGVNALINVLRGEKEVAVLDDNGEEKTDANGKPVTETVKVSPSGRTADTYAYDIFTAPSSVNAGKEGARKYNGFTGTGKGYYDAYIDYYEGIYVGYKWYETAFAESYWDAEEFGGYDKVVQYPFGYGLSYTSFEWNVKNVEVNGKSQTSGDLPQKGEIELTVEVKNTGNYPAMDVVQLYYTPQYIKGGIEKAYVNLGAFAKTNVIEPGESETVTLSITVQSMASYDCYDANANSHTGYELDGGDYYLRLMKNSHDNGNMAEGSEAVYHYTVPAEGYNYDTDETTGAAVENRFTNKNGKGNDQTIDNADLDGSQESVPVKYLSRANFAGTFPEKILRSRSAAAYQVASSKEPTDEQLKATGYYDIEKLPNGEDTDMTLEDMMPQKNGDSYTMKDWKDDDWDWLIYQVTVSELKTVIKDGYFKTAAIKSIGKPEYVDLDGPLGLNTRVTGTTQCEFVAYPSATVLAQTWDTALAYAMGLSVGNEAKSMQGLRGWYAPGANIHRNPFCGRNGEYYSEDGVLSGKMAAGAVRGAKDMGVYSYVKHFVANESETFREGLYTFMTEQTLREIYLKPFEIVTKEGGGNALMTSMNRLGRVWSGANYGLCTEILRNEWKFRGTLVTDWLDTNKGDYMPAYKGIWAGNDLWLNNTNADYSVGNLLDKIPDAQMIALGQKVVKNVLWTLIDSEYAKVTYDPDAAIGVGKGAQYNHTWYWYVALVEVALAAGVGVMAFFLVKNILNNRKSAVATAGSAPEGTEDNSQPDIAAETEEKPKDES